MRRRLTDLAAPNGTAPHHEVTDNPMSLLHMPDPDRRGAGRAERRFETQPASAIIRWAVDAFHPHLCLTASMTDAVLIDLAVKVEPSIEVVFIDTGYHFPETMETVELVRRRYGLNLRVMTALPQARSCGRSTRRTAARPSRPASSTGPCSASRPG